MKKAIVAVLVVIVAVVVGVVLLKRSPAVRSVDAARLVPADTLLFASVPDVHSTATRWKETALYQILQEPEVQAFLEKPKSKAPSSAEWNATVERLKQIDPTQFFVAVVSVTNNMPHAVLGFSYKGDRKAVESAVAEARKRAQEASPAGKDELVQYKGLEIESYSDKGITVAGAFASNWYFAGNDVDLLKATLDRFVSSPSEGTLAHAEFYKNGTAKLPPNPETYVFVQPGFVIDKLAGIAAATGQQIDEKQLAELKKIQGFAAATRFEHERIRDTVFILQPGAEKMPALTQATLSLTRPETLLYLAFVPHVPEKIELPDTAADATGVLNGMKAFAQELAKNGLSVGDFKAAFGPEFSLQSDWAPAAFQPSFNLSAQVKDLPRARKVLDALIGDWQREDLPGGNAVWSMPSSESAKIIPAIGLSGKFLVAGIRADDVKAALGKAASPGKTLDKTPLYMGAISTVSKPEMTAGYLDSKALFEHVYSMLRPMAMLWGGFSPQANQFVDLGKLPTTEAISKHLSPIVFSSSQLDNGTLIESTGPVTVYEGLIGLGTIGGAIAAPIMQGKMAIPGIGPFSSPSASPAGGALSFPTQPSQPPFAPGTTSGTSDSSQ